MMEISYRAATVADIETLALLRWEMESERSAEPPFTRDAFVAAYVEETREDLARGIQRAWLAEADGQAVACALLIWWAMPPNHARLHRRRGFVSSVYTRTAYRRRGISRALMTRLIAEARALGIHRLVLWASAMGRPLYEDLGFVPCRGMELNIE